MKFLFALPLSLAALFSVTPIYQAVAQAIPTCAQPGEGAGLLEGECVSIFGGYQRQNFNRTISTFASDTNRFSIGIQGQKAVADRWYVSLNAGYADVDMPRNRAFGLEREVKSISFGASIKYVEKDLLLSASIGASRNDVDQTTTAGFANTPGQGLIFSNEETNYSAVLALRAATLIDDGNGFYAKPSMDVGLIYTHAERADAAIFGLPFQAELETSNHVFAFITPALEVGLDLVYNDYSVRPFVFAGARFLFKEDETRTINGTDTGVVFRDDELSVNRNSKTAFLGAGAILFATGGLSSRATYTASFERRVVTHSIGAQIQLDF